MSGPWAVGVLGLWAAVLSLIFWGALASGAYSLLRQRVILLEPRARERLLFAWAAAPWAMGLLLVAACFLPSIQDWLGWAADHCLSHLSHHAHFCFHHGGLAERSMAVGALAGLTAVALVVAGRAVLRTGREYLNLAGELRALSEPGEGYHRVLSHRPFALTLGLLSPEIFVSRRLEEDLTEEDLQVVMAHERGHVARRDGLRKVALAILTAPYLPPIRRLLLSDHAFACEQTCDALASDQIGEPALVARALVAVARLEPLGFEALPGPACGFRPGPTSLRVRALLAPRWERSGHLWGAAFLILFTSAAVSATLAAGPLHHAVETALAVLF